MKRCPTCQKTYADTMRFCQIDGTSLVDDNDPYKTIVGGTPPSFQDDEDFLELSEQGDSKDTLISPDSKNSDFNQNEENVSNRESPFDSPLMPNSSPFDSGYQAPNFGDQSSTSQTDAPFYASPPSFEQSQFEQNQSPFGQPMQQNQWSPPLAPEADWQNQDIGANTPFQPPLAMQGQNQTLPVISLVCGVLAFVLICCYGGAPFGIAALVTGFLGIQNFNKDSINFSGKGLAIAGMILGGISLVLTIIFFIFGVALGALGNLAR